MVKKERIGVSHYISSKWWVEWATKIDQQEPLISLRLSLFLTFLCIQKSHRVLRSFFSPHPFSPSIGAGENTSLLYTWLLGFFLHCQVGKGLSKDERARKLALQHWLEAVRPLFWLRSLLIVLCATLSILFVDFVPYPKQIDPRHRYGHNLQFYYVKWLHCESKQPFFYWYERMYQKSIEKRSKTFFTCNFVLSFWIGYFILQLQAWHRRR